MRPSWIANEPPPPASSRDISHAEAAWSHSRSGKRGAFTADRSPRVGIVICRGGLRDVPPRLAMAIPRQVYPTRHSTFLAQTRKRGYTCVGAALIVMDSCRYIQRVQGPTPRSTETKYPSTNGGTNQYLRGGKLCWDFSYSAQIMFSRCTLLLLRFETC